MTAMRKTAFFLVVSFACISQAFAQDTRQPSPSQAPPEDQPRFESSVTVVAAKEPEDKQKLPLSITAVTKNIIDRMGVRFVSDAAIVAPNTLYSEFTARKLSNTRVRGVGASQGNPGITTIIDGVPQFNTNSSSFELIDTQQIEFVRGPQSALFGRNTLGGLVNVISSRPAQTRWSGMFSVPFGNFGSWSARGSASGPVVDGTLSLGVSFAQAERDGFTVNDVTGNDVDYRQASSVKAQALWTPTQNWEAHFIVSGERARDGDYALADLEALRSTPFHVQRDFEGHTDRDIFNTTIQTRLTSQQVVLTTNTGFVRWDALDVTDLDYLPLPIIERDNSEKAFQFTQEVRFASATPKPLGFADQAALKWQAGVFFFTQNFDQAAINHISPQPLLPLALDLHSPEAALDDLGVGVFGQGTITFNGRFDVTAGARFDYEYKSANIDTFYDPPLPFLAPRSTIVADKSFSEVSPQLSVTFRPQAETAVYGNLSRGFKAGGFNPTAPSGREAFDEEHAWHYEGGIKSTWVDGRVMTNLSVFYIDWDNLQTFAPNPADPTQFFVTNAGAATSKGVEVEVSARAAPGFDVFSTVGFTNARFSDGTTTSGIDVSGNKLQLTPDYTASIGAQLSCNIGQSRLFARADTVFYGQYNYDDFDGLSQEAYTLTNLRGGVGFRQFTIEAFIRNAFDERYIPVLFPFPDFAPSGYLGELGAPRTFGVSAGVRF
jgi:iron complex outermembrane receptor protein